MKFQKSDNQLIKDLLTQINKDTQVIKELSDKLEKTNKQLTRFYEHNDTLKFHNRNLHARIERSNL